MSRWFVALVALLFAMPILVLTVAGGIALWRTGWYTWLWWLMPLCWGLAYLILNRSWERHRPSLAPDPGQLWSPRDTAAWQIVLAEAKKAAELPAEALTKGDTYLQTARALAEQLAHHYHPGSTDPLAELTLVEIFTCIELAARDMNEIVRGGVPGSHLLTVGKFRLLADAPRWYNWASNAMWAVSALFNPASAAARYLGSRLTVSPLMEKLRGNMIAWFYSAYVQKVGQHLIELNSGRLRVGADRWRELQTQAEVLQSEPGAAPPAPSDKSAELTIALVGQVKAGKSSLINAILGEEKAQVDVLPATANVTRYRFSPADVPIRITLLDTVGYSGGSDPKAALESALTAVCQSHVTLLVVDAQQAARAADHGFLVQWQEWFTAHPERKPPPILGVMTHIDLLPPSLEWQPPYDGWVDEASPRLKEQTIRDAILSIKETLMPPLAGVIPACTAAGKLYGLKEWLWPAVLGLLPQAHARRINEAFLNEGAAGRWRQLWQQVKTSAQHLAKAGLSVQSSDGKATESRTR